MRPLYAKDCKNEEELRAFIAAECVTELTDAQRQMLEDGTLAGPIDEVTTMRYIFNPENKPITTNDIFTHIKEIMVDCDIELSSLETQSEALIAALDRYPLNMVFKNALWKIKADSSGEVELAFLEMADKNDPSACLNMLTALRDPIDSLTVATVLNCKDSPRQLTCFDKLELIHVSRQFDAAGGNAHERVYLYSFKSSYEIWDTTNV